MGSGKSGADQNALNDYYSSQGAVYAASGSKVYLVAYLVDDKEVWKPGSPIDLSAVSNPYQFDIADRGRRHVYDGRAAQTLTDPVLTANDRDHPNMRNKLVMVEEDALAGLERTSVPDSKLVIWRQADQTIVTGNAAALDADGQSNPIAALAEVLTSEINGTGKADATADATSWQSVADTLYADSGNEYLSIKLDNFTTFRDFASLLRGYVDFWMRRTATGTIELGLWSRGEDAPEGLEVISEHDLEPGTVPQRTPSIKENLPNLFTLVWTNPDLAYDDDTARYATERTSVDREMEFKRPFIIRGDQAQTSVTRLGKRESTTKDDLVLSVRESKARLVKPGDLFIHSYTQSGYLKICRCLKRKGFSSKGGYVRIEAETDRGLSPSAAAFAFENANWEAEAVPTDLVYWHVIQAPQKFDDEPYSLIALAGRLKGQMSGFNVWFRDGSSDFQFLGQQRRWAVPVQLAADYDDTEAVDDETGNLKIKQYTTDVPFGFDRLQTSMTEDEIADDHMLLVIVSATDPTQYEFLSVKTINSPVSSEYPVHVLRARQGSIAQSFLEDDPAYLILRSDLVSYNHQSLATMALEPLLADRQAFLKLQPYSFRNRLALASATEKTLEIVERLVSDPTNVKVEGLLAGFAVTFDQADEDVETGKLWYSQTTIRPASHSKSFEVRPGANRVEYFDESFTNAPIRGYFWLQNKDRKGNESNIVGYYTANSGSTVDDGQRVTIVASRLFFIYHVLLPNSQTAILTAHAEGYDSAVQFQWYRRYGGGSNEDLEGEIESVLEVQQQEMPAASVTFGVRVNGAQYDEVTIWIGSNGTSTKSPLLTNEVVTVLVDEAGDPLAGELGELGSTVSKARLLNGAALFTPVASAPTGVEFSLSVPTGITKLGNDGFYVSSAAALTSDETDFTITFNYDGGSTTRNFRVVKRTIANLAAKLEITADGPLIYEDPISDTDLTLTGTVSKGPDNIVATRDAIYNIDTGGNITIVDAGGYTENFTQAGLDGKDYRLSAVVLNDGAGNDATLNGKTKGLSKLTRITDAYALRWYSSFDDIFSGAMSNADIIHERAYTHSTAGATASAAARSEGAAEFDGATGHISAYIGSSGSDDDVAPLVQEGADFYVSFWAKATDHSGRQTIVTNQRGSGTGREDVFTILLDFSTNEIVVRHRDTSTSVSESKCAYTFDTNWHHYLVFFDESEGDILFYVDGSLEDTITPSNWIEMPATSGSALRFVRFGAIYDWTDTQFEDFFEGLIDEFAIVVGTPDGDDIDFFNTDRQSRYEALLHTPVHLRTRNAIADYSTWNDTLLMHIRTDGALEELDQGSPNIELADQVGPGFEAGPTGQAATFDGTQYALFDVDNAYEVVAPSAFTLSFMAKIPIDVGDATTRALVRFFQTTSQSGVQVQRSTRTMSFGLWDNNGGTEELDISVVYPDDGEWHHYAYTTDSVANTVKVYIDGRLAAMDNTFTGSFPTGAGDVVLGAGYFSGYTQFFIGSLSDILTFSRVFDEFEVQALADRYSGWTYQSAGVEKYVEDDHEESYANAASKTLQVRPRASAGQPQTVTLLDAADGSEIVVETDLTASGLAIVKMAHNSTGANDSVTIATNP